MLDPIEFAILVGIFLSGAWIICGVALHREVRGDES